MTITKHYCDRCTKELESYFKSYIIRIIAPEMDDDIEYLACKGCYEKIQNFIRGVD